MNPRTQVASLVLAASTLVGIAVHEGYKDEAYIPVAGDVPTIDFGRTKGVKMGDKSDPVRGLQYLLDEVESVYAAGVKRCVKVPLYQHEYEAYVSLAYNIGVGAFCRKAKPGKPPNLIDLINAERYEEACERIKAFNKFKGKPLRGLTIRREAEYRQCIGIA